MDDTPNPHDAPAIPAKPRRRGLIAPLPAVMVGLGLASGPAGAQPIQARPDAFTIPSGAQSFLPVLANDTFPNASAFVFPVGPPIPGGNVFAGNGGLRFLPPSGYVGQITFPYCINGGSPPAACANVALLVLGPEPIPAMSGAALAGLSGVLAWLGLRLRRRG